MNITKSAILNSTIESYFQFQHQFPGKVSALFADIKTVLGCDEQTAENLASTHCNMISFWACMFASGRINMPYDSFFKNMLNSKFCNEHGFFLAEKTAVCMKIFGIPFEIKYFQDWEDVLNPASRLDPKSFYQIKIHTGDGYHFMSTYIDDNSGVLMGSDTSYRGTPYEVAKIIIPAAQFVWLLRIG